jgi:hypothetical protein
MKLATPLGLAAVATTFIISTLAWRDKSSSVSAQQILDDAAKAIQNTTNLHISARMRTMPAESPGFIDVNGDFIPVEIY